jgi:hypothetical protein
MVSGLTVTMQEQVSLQRRAALLRAVIDSSARLDTYEC